MASQFLKNERPDDTDFSLESVAGNMHIELSHRLLFCLTCKLLLPAL